MGHCVITCLLVEALHARVESVQFCIGCSVLSTALYMFEISLYMLEFLFALPRSDAQVVPAEGEDWDNVAHLQVGVLHSR
mgnify:CR=1 FL=1